MRKLPGADVSATALARLGALDGRRNVAFVVDHHVLAMSEVAVLVQQKKLAFQ